MTENLQEFIINDLKTKPTIDAAAELRTRVDFLKNYLKDSGMDGYTLGISGGQDSALAGALAQLATRELNSERGDNRYKFLALLLPYGQQKDILEAEAVAFDFIKADEVITFNIKDTVDALENTFNRNMPLGKDEMPQPLMDFHKGNAKARIRMTTQYVYGGQGRLLVVGSDHSSEAINGFFTKGGDGFCDVTPLTGLNKRQGKEILRLLGAPEFILVKAPTADLLDENPGQADEAELGVTYEDTDTYLSGGKIAPEKAAILEQRFLATEHKRRVPVSPYDTWVEEYKALSN